jgi:uncharacterized membrane protein (DUF106 family)
MKVLGVVTHQTTFLKDCISLLALTMLLTLPISAYLFICPQTTGLREVSYNYLYDLIQYSLYCSGVNR